MKLNVGCGGDYRVGYINVDHPMSKTRHDISIDLESDKWALDSESVDEILCNDMLEHLSRPDKAMFEMHRILKKGGILIGQVPYAKSDGAYQCMEHRWFFTEKSFDAFCSGDNFYVCYGTPLFKKEYVKLIDVSISPKTKMRNMIPRKARLFLTNFVWNMFDGVAFKLEKL
jgi:SAM-dependent methyltransferase